MYVQDLGAPPCSDYSNPQNDRTNIIEICWKPGKYGWNIIYTTLEILFDISFGVTVLVVTKEKHMDTKLGSTICTGWLSAAAPKTQDTTREMARYRNKITNSPRLVAIQYLQQGRAPH